MWAKSGYPTCQEVGTQSPINVIPSDANDTGHEITITGNGYNAPEQAIFILDPDAVQVNIASAGAGNYSVTTQGKKFNLVQWHYHSPAEHVIDGKYFPLEAHYVHQAADGHLLVVAVMIGVAVEQSSVGYEASMYLNNVFDGLPNQGFSPYLFPWYGFSPSISPPQSFDKVHFEYVGSLTSPPCTHGLQWIISGNPVYISLATLSRYRTIINGNANNQLGVFAPSTWPPWADQAGSYYHAVGWDKHLKTNNRPVQPFDGPNSAEVPRNYRKVGQPTLSGKEAFRPPQRRIASFAGLMCLTCAVCLVFGVLLCRSSSTRRRDARLMTRTVQLARGVRTGQSAGLV